LHGTVETRARGVRFTYHPAVDLYKTVRDEVVLPAPVFCRGPCRIPLLKIFLAFLRWARFCALQLRKEFDMTTETGTVKWFNEGKGFGFIAPDGGGKDLFAHFKEIQGSGFKTLTENQRVQFEVTQGQKGLQASNIRSLG
jgi:CspA family cold shock protein